jgi:hypothetical protein
MKGGAVIDTRLRAEFKEWAREIISRDRAARKRGQSQNTIGAIERSLAKAFKMGRTGRSGDADFRPVPSEDGAIEWEQIMPRSRDTLWSLSVGMARWKEEEGPPLLEHFSDNGRDRWRISGEPLAAGRCFSKGGVMPLVRLGILDPANATGNQLRMTKKGVATCKEFWRRWDARDPTLPLMSVRG